MPETNLNDFHITHIHTHTHTRTHTHKYRRYINTNARTQARQRIYTYIYGGTIKRFEYWNDRIGINMMGLFCT